MSICQVPKAYVRCGDYTHDSIPSCLAYTSYYHADKLHLMPMANRMLTDLLAVPLQSGHGILYFFVMMV